MPEDLVVWSDLDRDFELDGKGDIKVALNANSVLQSVKNILETMLGQRVMRNNFASSVNLKVFEPIDELTRLEMSDELKTSIEAWDNRVTVDEVTFSTDGEQKLLNLVVSIAIRGHAGVFPVETRFN